MKQTACKLCGAAFICDNGRWFTTCNCARDRPQELKAAQDKADRRTGVIRGAMMAKYRKRPVVVEAEQFFPDKPLPFNERGPVVCFDGKRWYVVTIHCEKAQVVPGDWVILEPRGLHHAYPCKPDIFEATYEPAE